MVTSFFMSTRVASKRAAFTWTALKQSALFFGGLFSILLVAGCASRNAVAPGAALETPAAQAVFSPQVPPDTDALKTRIALQDRLYRLAAPLLVNNTELCKGNARKLLGFTAKNKYSYTSEYVDAAEHGLGLGERLVVMAVLPGSGAARSGLHSGDVLVGVDEKPMPEGPNAERLAASILGPLVSSRSIVKLTLLREGMPQSVTIPLTLACAFSIELGNSDNINAYSDGRRVMITRGMMTFVRNDTELAYVIAREMAHNALGHAARLRTAATLGGIIDNLIRLHPDLSSMGGMAGVKPFPGEVDAAADTLSLYMLARAGYEVEAAPAFWQRLATDLPPTVLNGYTAIHPSTGYRLTVMEKVAPQVKAKVLSNAPLKP